MSADAKWTIDKRVIGASWPGPDPAVPIARSRVAEAQTAFITPAARVDNR
jgi:hypothetical protein